MRKIKNLLSMVDKVAVEEFAALLKKAKKNARIYLAGNGGSASTMSHFASDLANLGFDAFCLNDNLVRLTALANDKGWDRVYLEQLRSLFRNGDVLVLASVHGGVGKDQGDEWSQNLIQAAKYVQFLEGTVLSLVGGNGGNLKELSSVCVVVPSWDAYHVEAIHSVLTHMLCGMLK